MDEFTKSVPNADELEDEKEKEIFPAFLFEPLFNVFDDDDNFYQVVSDEYENIKEVMKLKRKYRDYYKWQDALAVYNAYMEYLEEKYGSISIVKLSLEEGAPLDDYIPPKPKLKKNPVNKQIMKTGFVPPRRSVSAIDGSSIRAIADSMFHDENIDYDSQEYDELPEYVSKKDMRTFQRAMNKTDRENRVNNVKLKNNRHSGADIIEDYYNQLQRGGYNSYGKRVDPEDISIEELMRNAERIEMEDPELLAYEESLITNPIVYLNGTGMKKSRADQLEIMKEFLREGFSLDMFGSGDEMDKKAVKMVKMSLGITDSISTADMSHMSKKQRKKAMKKMRKQSKNAQLQDERIDSILMSNKISHGGSNIDFRINNLRRR